jgi:hypothetical protein
MKVGKFGARALGCLLLLLNVTACSFLQGDDAAPTPTPSPASDARPQLTVAQAEDNVRRAERDLERVQEQAKDGDKAKAEATALRKAADAAKKKAEELQEQTRQAGKNPDDSNDAPITYKATQDWKAAEARATDAEQNLSDPTGAVARAKTRVEIARKALEEVRQREPGVSASPTPGATAGQSTPAQSPADGVGGGDSNLLSWLPLFLSLLTLLGVVGIGVVGYSLLTDMRERLEDIRSKLGTTEITLEDIIKNQAKPAGVPNTQDERMSGVVTKLSILQTTVDNVEGLLKETTNSVSSIQRSLQSAPPPPPQNFASNDVIASAPRDGQSRVEFPMTAENYLSRVENNLVPVKYDYIKKMLLRVDDGEGLMFLVEDGSAPGNMYYVVPQIKRFQAKGDFMAYSEYFDCANPSAGEIMIIQPATAYRAPGGEGWMLHDKGVLKV